MLIRAAFTLVVRLLPSVGLIACQSTLPTPPVTVTTQPVVTTPSNLSTKPPAEDVVRLIAANCLNCHGSSGQGAGTIPSLANLSVDDLASRLKNFKNGSLASTIMGRHAKAYSDAEIEATAKYIAGRKN